MYSYGPPHMAGQKQDDQLKHTCSSYVRIWDVALKTCQRRWTIGRSGERGLGISMPVARQDDDDDISWSQKFQLLKKCFAPYLLKIYLLLNKKIEKNNFYHLKYPDFCLHLHCYTHNILANASFSRCFLSNSGAHTELWTEHFI